MGETHDVKPTPKSESGVLKPKPGNQEKSIKSEKDQGKSEGKRRSRNKKSKTGSLNESKVKKKPDFKGGETKMNGHVFELHDESLTPGQFIRSKQEVERLVQSEYDHGHDIVIYLQTRQECDINADMPQDLTDKTVPDLDSNGDEQPDPNDSTKILMKIIKPTAVEKELWKEDIKLFSERHHTYKMNKQSLWSLLLGQCSPRLLAHLQSLQEFRKRYAKSDSIWLLDEIQRAMSKFERTRYPHVALIDAYSKLFRFFQGDGMSDTNFDLRFDEFQTLLEHYGSNLGMDPLLIKYEIKEKGKDDSEIETIMGQPGSTEYQSYAKLAQERFFAALYLMSSNKTDYRPLLNKLENDYAQGSRRFPANVIGARNIKLTFRKEYEKTAATKQSTGKSGSGSNHEDKENVSPAITLTQFQTMNESDSQSEMSNEGTDDSDLSEEGIDDHGELSDEDIPSSTPSLFDYAFVTASDVTPPPPSNKKVQFVALTQVAHVVTSNNDSDNNSVPELVDRVDAETSGDESTVRPTTYDTSDNESVNPFRMNRAYVTSSEHSDSDSSDDESDDEFVHSNFFPRRRTQFPGLTRRRNTRRRFFDSSDDDSSSSSEEDNNQEYYSTAEEESNVSSDAPPGLISREDQVSSDDDSSDYTSVTAHSTDDESEDESDSDASNPQDDVDPPFVEAGFDGSPCVSFNNSDTRSVPENWILLDTESSVSIFCTADFLTNIHTVPSNQRLRLHGTGGHIDVFEKGTLPDFGEVWYSHHSVANILSFAEVAEQFDISFHQEQHAFHVTHPSGRTLVFACRPPGRLYYFDASQMLAALPSASPSHSPPSSVLVALDNAPVSSAPVDLTPEEQRIVERVDPIYRAFGCPAPKSFEFMLRHDKIVNCPIDVSEFQAYCQLLKHAHPDALAGHATRKTPLKVNPTLVPIPPSLMEKLEEVIICADLCFIPKNKFLCTVSRKIDFFTGQPIANKKMVDTVLPAIETIIHLYRLRGFKPVWILTDMEFRALEKPLLELGVRINITSENEHVGQIERGIRTTKEDVRTILHSLPFNRYPTILLREVFLYAIFMRNLMVDPKKREGFSPASLVIGTEANYKENCSLPCGTLCYVKANPKPYNSVVEPRMVAAISLKPLGNVQGGYTFLQIHNWEIVTRYQWKVGAYTQEILKQIEEKAMLNAEKNSAQEQSDVDNFIIRHADKSIMTSFEDDDSHLIDIDIFGQAIHHQTTIDPEDQQQNDNEMQEDNDPEQDDDDDENEHDDDDQNNEHDDDDAGHDDDDETDPHATDETEDGTDDRENEKEGESVEPPEEPPESDAETGAGDVDDENQERGDVDIEETETGVEVTLDEPQRNSTAKDTIPSYEVSDENIMDPPAPDPNRAGLGAYNLRRQVEPTYKTTLVQVDEDDLVKLHYVPPVPCMRDSSNLWEVACTQMSATEGVKRYGERAEAALIKEWMQLNDMEVYEGRHWWQLSKDQRRRSMRLVQLIKEKRCGKIKGRTCVDGRPQRQYIPKEDATSPTVHLESLMLSMIQDAHDDRCVGVVDIPGAFLHTPSDEDDHVVVDGVMVDMLVKSNSDYAKYVHTTKSGKRIVYLKLRKHMYGTLKAARKFYEALCKLLIEHGFTPNPYDPCVMNKDIDGYQCTVLWHVDDMKISHKKKEVVLSTMQILADKYGELKPTIGKNHSYVGMEIEYPGDKTVHIDMKSYIQTALDEFPEPLGKSATSPAAEHIFQVDPNGIPIPEPKRIIFHTIVARLLYLSTRARPDIYPTISFLTSRCSNADEHDWKKLRRLLTYLRDTIDLTMILRADNMSVIKWWVDAAYGVRHDFKSQTGAAMSMGTGIFQAKSVKQGLNTKSSTEAEVVAASDMAPYLLWTRYFLEAQGVTINRCILYQDNESAMLLERNGTFSSSKRTKHINIRFFWLKDRIKTGEIEIEHCGTDKMIADFFTKPLQGAKFLAFRNQILGHAIIPDYSDANQERVEMEANTTEQSFERVTNNDDAQG